ncbi:S8 family serine peptidase [Reichenbachiella ulvae]|uniref:S8 family serine peptidase n=1 Tax=Reichenbachiella ulvae TaxID=2980104 RepID=A0ABT3CSA4_9BACT|nr:S8 family serine peptidase [Reichenbachiella ulvae]MCV9386461.1 S8 family serine peptidase [Reichenbachiella ulvae]
MLKLRLFCLLMFVLGVLETFGQTQEVYIKIDETVDASIQSRSRIKTISIQELNGKSGVKSLRSIRPEVNSSGRRSHNPGSAFLKGIYRLEVETSEVEGLVSELASYDNVLAVEKTPKFEVLVVPSDERVSEQDYLGVIQAFDAWDVTKGGSNQIIGVSDTGFDMDHEDLLDNIYINESDWPNGIDDDNNGYIDDYRGWDVADGDSDPNYPSGETNSHGSNVAGVIAAVPNNGLGIAGVAYNSKFVPIKLVRSSDGTFNNAYESIIYAADLGCDVINLSWGSPDQYSMIAQDVINYAVLEKNMVVVAAAGNTDAEINYYPASYDHVLSVGKSTVTDRKADNATWSYHIDLMAPGQSVLSTNINDGYVVNTGSSFSAPQVAGTAALVRSVFPSYNAIQIMEQIRMTADDIYGVSGNNQYSGQLGKGRLNVFRAVTEKDVASIRCYDYAVSYPFEIGAFPGDTVTVSLSFENILRPTDAASVHIEPESEFVEVLNEELLLGSLYTFESIEGLEVKMIVKEGIDRGQRLSFRMNYEDASGYEDFQYFHIYTAPEVLQLHNQKIQQTIASNGNLAYGADVYAQGAGLRYEGEQVAGLVGIAIGNHPDSISDNWIRDFVQSERSQDFVASQSLKMAKRDDASSYALGMFNDSSAVNVQGLLIEQEALLFDGATERGFMIQEYRVTNTSPKDLLQMKMGLYADFNLGESLTNYSEWDEVEQMGYTYSQKNSGLMAGVLLLTNQTPIFHALDLKDAQGNHIEVDSVLSDSVKYQLLTEEKLLAGGDNGYDVAQILTADLGALNALSSQKVTFATVFGYSLEELQLNADKARAKYADFIMVPTSNWWAFGCEGDPVSLQNPNPFSIYSDAAGSNLVLEGGDLTIENVQADSVLYYTETKGGYTSDLYKMELRISNPEVSVRMDPEMYFLGDDANNRVQFIDQSLKAVSWDWSFDNGFFSKAQNPTTVFNEVGDYAINLNILTEQGCTGTGQWTYQVRERGVVPTVTDQSICAGERVRIVSSSSALIRVYNLEQGGELLAEGASWQTPALQETKTYYVSAMDAEYESLRVPLKVEVDPVVADFMYFPDTMDLSGAEMVRIQNISQEANQIEWSVDGQQMGSDESLIMDVSLLSGMNVQLQATSNMGCVSSITKPLTFQTSTQPGVNELTDREVCKGGMVLSRPLYGEYFAFYADQSLTQLVAKGTSATLGPVLSDTSFYITNISDFHQSNAVELEVRLNDFDLELVATPEMLDFGLANSAMFSLVSHEGVSSYQWFVADEFVEIADTLNYTFYQLGEYKIELVAESIEGCTDTLSMRYLVDEPLQRHDIGDLLTYPNPTKEAYFIKGEGLEVSSIRLYSALGQQMEVDVFDQGSYLQLQTEALPKGIYFVVFRQHGEEIQRKMIKH